MFCNQCEETARGCACTARGVCGKDPETAGLQDVLIWVCRGLASRNLAAGDKGDPDVGMFIAGALFGTLTNVDFDPDRIRRLVREAVALRDLLPPAGPGEPEANTWAPADDAAIQAKAAEIAADAAIDDDVHSLRTLLLAGLKGLAAYYYHAASLGYTDESVTEFLQRALAADLRELTADELVGLAMECGTVGVTALALLDRANTETFGHPEITTVRTTVGDRPGILVTGHDLADLKQLLDQTRESGVDVYTHGEMLPAHAYPAFKGYPQLVGNYGGAWWKQADEFARFNGPVLVTTNCIVPPREAYRDRIFTTGPAGYPGVPHIGMARDGTKDFSPLIERAKRSPPPEPLAGSGRELTTGCAHQAGRRDRGLGGRRDQERGDPAVRGHGRLRRPAARAGVLHRVRRGPAEGHGDPDRGLREVPVQRARPRHDRRHPAGDRRGPVQRQLLARGDRAAARRGLRGRDQRPADLVQHRLVRAEGRARPARPAQRRRQGHHPRAPPARVPLAGGRWTCSCSSSA